MNNFNKIYTALFLFFLISHSKLNGQIAVFPFNDESGFKTKWNLSIDIPNYFRTYLKEKFDIPVLSPNLMKGFFISEGKEISDYNSLDYWKEAAEFYKIKYILIGSVKEFKLSKFNAGFPLLAGYESYSCSQYITFRLYDVPNEKMIINGELNSSLADRGLGITLAGKPTERNKQYNTIDEIEFGSEDFSKTLIGESMIRLSVDLSSQIEPYIHLMRPDKKTDYSQFEKDTLSIKKRYIYGTIIMLQNDDIFIDLGSSDGVIPGEKLFVFYPEFEALKEKVEEINLSDKIAGIIEVKEVRSNHFSLCKINLGRENLKVKYIVQKTIIK